MRPSRVDLYEIDENEFGELLIAVPDLGAEAEAAEFDVSGADFLVLYQNGEVVRLPAIPPPMLGKLSAAQKLLVMESDGVKPLRCYPCERVMG